MKAINRSKATRFSDLGAVLFVMGSAVFVLRDHVVRFRERVIRFEDCVVCFRAHVICFLVKTVLEKAVCLPWKADGFVLQTRIKTRVTDED